MKKSIFCCFCFLYCLIFCLYYLESANVDETTPSKQSKPKIINQPVKTCCAQNKIFNIITKSCIPLDNISITSNLLKTDALHNLLRINKTTKLSKKNIQPVFSPLQPKCVFDIYQLSSLDQISLDGNNLEVYENRKTYFRFHHLHNDSDYCVDKAVNIPSIKKDSSLLDTVVIKCLPDQDLLKTIIRFCCISATEKYEPKTNQCRRRYKNESIDTWTVLDDVDKHKPYDDMESGDKADVTTIHHGLLSCMPNQVQKSNREQFIMYNTGSIKVEHTIFSHNEYCMSDVELTSPSSSIHTALILRCEYTWRYILVNQYVASLLCTISEVFLFALMLLLIKNNGHRLFGVMELSVTANLFLHYLVLTVVKMSYSYLYKQYPTVCYVAAIIMQFTYLSVMFWLNAMSFDVWSTFRFVQNEHQLTSRKVRHKGSLSHMLGGFKHPKYKWYALYALGIPLLVTVCTVTMHHLPSTFTEGYVTPGIGEDNCFFQSRWAKFIYFYMLAGIALLFTCILFGLFAWNLWFGLWAKRHLDRSEE